MGNFKGSQIGGAETQQFLFAKTLQSSGYNVEFIVARPNAFTKTDDNNLPDWVKVAYSLRSRSSKIGFLKDTIKLFFAMKKVKADLFIQRCSFHDAPRVWLFSKLLNSKFLFWIGSDFNVDIEYQKNNLSFLRRISYQYSLAHSNAIVSQTKKQQNMLLNSFNLSSHIIRNIVQTPYEQDCLPSKPIIPTAIWGGRINPNKRPELLIELALGLPNWSFIFVAISDRCLDAQYSSFFQQASSLPNARVMPSLPHEEYIELTSQVHLVLNTSITEGYPNTLLEAFAHAVPTLTLGVDPDNAITSNNLGWVCSGLNSAIQKMQYLFKNQEELTSAGENARLYVQRNHSTKLAIDDLGKLLNSILKV